MSENGGHILVVDDNEMNRDMLARRLQRYGFTTAVAEHGAKALELLREETFDLVMLDIMMPVLNGYQVLEIVKNEPDLRHIPIIMISAVDDLDSVVKCIEMGAEDYLFKPFNPVLLKARVSATLDKHRNTRGQIIKPMLQAIAEDIETLSALPLTEAGRDAVARLRYHVTQALDTI